MESQIATHNDADIILKLYDLRRETVLRRARQWLIFEFNPKTPEEFLEVVAGFNTQENSYFRQVTSYWEMAASLVVHGAVKSDLFIDSNAEGIYIFAKFQPYLGAFEAKMGRQFMRQTSVLIDKYPSARDRFQSILKSITEQSS
jgi:hypothetical protein